MKGNIFLFAVYICINLTVRLIERKKSAKRNMLPVILDKDVSTKFKIPFTFFKKPSDFYITACTEQARRACSVLVRLACATYLLLHK